MQTHKEQVSALSATATKLASSGHFEASKIIELKGKLNDWFVIIYKILVM